MSRRHVMVDVEEKELDSELPHSDIHRGRLIPAKKPAEIKVEVASLIPERATVVEVTSETQLQGKRKKLGKRADGPTEDVQDDPAVG